MGGDLNSGMLDYRDEVTDAMPSVMRKKSTLDDAVAFSNQI